MGTRKTAISVALVSELKVVMLTDQAPFVWIGDICGLQYGLLYQPPPTKTKAAMELVVELAFVT